MSRSYKDDLVWIIVLVVLAFCLLAYRTYDDYLLRKNAMDLCAWNARQLTAAEKGEPIDGREATGVYARVIRGRQTCPFCGQLHDERWVSRNAWDSLINASDPTGEKRRQFSR